MQRELSLKRFSMLSLMAIICLLSVPIASPSNVLAAEMRESIAAIVNEDPITSREVDERIALVLVSSQLPNKDEIRERLRPQVLDQLIEEQLKLQEAERLEISITAEQIKTGILSVAQSNDLTYEDFIQLLRSQDVKIRTLRRQVKAQIAWSQVIGTTLRPRIRISDQDVEGELNRLRSSLGKTEYLLAEIYLPFNQSNSQAEVEQFAGNIVSQMIKQNAPFQRVAQQFSQSAAAARGGDIGWVQEGQLTPALDDAIKVMKQGNLSQPIKTLSGYHILLLRDKRTITEDVLPTADEVKQRLGLERLERLQRRDLLDLRTSAFIEVRV